MDYRFLLVGAFVFLCQAVFFSAALPVDPEHVDEYKVHKNCTHKNLIHAHGGKWGDNCLKFQCVNGHVKIMQAACKFNDHCKSVGSVWTQHCIKRTCVFNEHGKPHLKVTDSRCQGKNDHCHKVGDKWHEKHHGKCQVRTCVKVHNAFVVKKLNEAC